jgi:hypothetical protein
MDEDSADQLDKWLIFAGGVWTQINRHKVLWDEIFHDAQITGNFPKLDELSPDKNVTIRLALKNAEVEVL